MYPMDKHKIHMYILSKRITIVNDNVFQDSKIQKETSTKMYTPF